MSKKYVAYVGTYTNGSSRGIHVYDVDVEGQRLKERNVVPVHNSSHITNPGMVNTCTRSRTKVWRCCALNRMET